MKTYGRIQGLFLSLWSAPFYRAVARKWRGIGLLYVLLLFFLTWIPTLIKMQIGFQQGVQENFPKVAKDLPTITIQGGKVSSPAPQPYVIKDQNTGKAVFVLDTTGEITSVDQLKDSPQVILLTQTQLHVRNPQKTEIHDLRNMPDMTISKEKVQEWLDFLGNFLAVGLFPIVMIGSLIRALILMLVAALFGMIFNSAFRSRLSFDALMRMAAVGMTLSVYLDMALGLANLWVPLWFLIALVLTTGYVAFGTYAAIPAPLPDPADFDEGFDDDGPYEDEQRIRR